MARSVIKKAKTVEDAIALALEEFNIDIENADVEILGNENDLSVVKVTEHITDEAKIKSFLDTVMSYLNADGTVRFSYPDEETIKVDITGENVSGLIGKRGDAIYAISYLSNILVNRDKDVYRYNR